MPGAALPSGEDRAAGLPGGRGLGALRDGRLACALFVASLPWMMLAHSAVNKFLGFVPEPWRALAYPETLAAIALNSPFFLAHGRPRDRERDPSWSLLLALAAACGVWFALCAVLQAAPVGYWSRRIGMEWIVAPLLGVAFHRHLDARGWALARSAFAWSLLLAAAYALALYFLSFGVPQSFHMLTNTIRTYRAQLTPRDGVYFGWYTFGGINDVASYFAIALVLYLGILAQRGERFLVRFALVPLVLLLQFLCYSRGVILGLVATTVALAAVVLGRRQVRAWSFHVALGMVALFVVGVFSPPGAFDYWGGQSLANPRSTAALRLRLWLGLLDAESGSEEFERTLPPQAIERMRSEAVRVAALPEDRPEAERLAAENAASIAAGVAATGRAPERRAEEAGAEPAGAPVGGEPAAGRAAAPHAHVVAELVAPREGDPAHTPFRWTPVEAADAYYLWVGTRPGLKDVVDSGETRELAWQLGPAPADVTLYIQMHTKIADVWRYQRGTLRIAAEAGGSRTVRDLRLHPIDLTAFPPAPARFDPEATALRERISARVGGQARRLLFGYGTGNYGLLTGSTADMGVHNIVLEAFVAGGIPGLALFGAFWATALYRLWRWTRMAPGAESWGVFLVGLLLTLVGIGVSVRLENLGTLVLGTMLWWLAAGPYAASDDAAGDPAYAAASEPPSRAAR